MNYHVVKTPMKPAPMISTSEASFLPSCLTSYFPILPALQVTSPSFFSKVTSILTLNAQIIFFCSLTFYSWNDSINILCLPSFYESGLFLKPRTQPKRNFQTLHAALSQAVTDKLVKKCLLNAIQSLIRTVLNALGTRIVRYFLSWKRYYLFSDIRCLKITSN